MERAVHSPPEGMHLFCRTGYSRDASGKGEGPFTQLPTLPLEPAQLEPGHNFHYEASEAIRGSVMHLIRLVFSHLTGSYLLYWHNCGAVTNSRQPTPTWPGFPAILQRRSGRNRLPGSYRTTQSGLTHSVHSWQIPQEWMDQLLEHCKGLDQQQGSLSC